MNSRIRNLCTLSLCLASSAVLAQETTPVASGRPSSPSVGIGAGWTFPGAASILTPNTASVRVRLGQLTLEPTFSFRGNGDRSHTDTSLTVPGQPAPQTTEGEDKGSGYTAGVGANVRYDLLSRGPFDLVGILGGRFSYDSRLAQVDVLDTTQRNEQRKNTIDAGLDWGLGVVWFLSNNLSVSADVTNPLLTFTSEKTTTERDRPNGNQERATQEKSGVDYGLSFSPVARVLFHLYF